MKLNYLMAPFYVEQGGQYLVLGDIFEISNEELVNLSRKKLF